jgi:hypothetical protein
MVFRKGKCMSGRRFGREAAQECSPRRKPWVRVEKRFSPPGRKNSFSSAAATDLQIGGIGRNVLNAEC